MAQARNGAGRNVPFLPAWRPQEHQLLVLDDQGAPKSIKPSDFGIGGRDRSWNAQAQNFISANLPQLHALSVEPELVPHRDGIDLRLRPSGVVGAVPLLAPDTRKITGGLLVRPRFGWDGIGPLLERVGWSAQPRILDLPMVPGSAREVPPWVLAGPVLDRLAALLKELRRGFRMQEAVRESPRGQILWGRYVTQQITRGTYHQLPCRYPDLGPDIVLRGHLRWGIEVVQRSLGPYSVSDAIARHLAERARVLLLDLQDTPARAPDHRSLNLHKRGTGLLSQALSLGLEALGWIVDERGLAGRSQSDGLAWAMPMYAVFERWVEHVFRTWASGFGGSIRSGHTRQTNVPIQWLRPGYRSLTGLVPDLVVHHGTRIYVIDAKYKGHFQELDETRWTALADELRQEHRHDVHQVLAYAALFEAPEVISVLVYPMHHATWQRLAAQRRTVARALLSAGGRPVMLAVLGLPMVLPNDIGIASLVGTLDELRAS